MPAAKSPGGGANQVTAWVEASGDIASAATALGGLLLVFIGAVSTGYGSYDAAARKAVRKGFLVKGLLALAGFFLALIAAALAVAGKVVASPCLVIGAVACLGVSFLVVCVAAVLSVMEIS